VFLAKFAVEGASAAMANEKNVAEFARHTASVHMGSAGIIRAHNAKPKQN